MRNRQSFSRNGLSAHLYTQSPIFLPVFSRQEESAIGTEGWLTWFLGDQSDAVAQSTSAHHQRLLHEGVSLRWVVVCPPENKILDVGGRE